MEKEDIEVLDEKKTEEQIREEARQEFEKEAEIKEQAKKELVEQQKQEEMKQSKKRGVFRFIYRFIITILIIFVIFETVMGLLNMNRLNDDKEPLWYINSKVTEDDGKKITTYNLGLYVIKKEEDNAGKKIVLRPFFLK